LFRTGKLPAFSSGIFYYFYPNLKPKILKNILLPLMVICFLITSNLKAQNSIELLIDDMLLVAQNFATPGAEGSALQASAGWFSSGSTLAKWKFEVSLHGNALFVPQEKQKQLFSNRDFQILNIRGSENALLPTVYGGETDVVFEGRIFNQDFSFDAIDGLDKKVLIHPFPQVTLGLPYSTEAAIRFMPSIVINDVGVSTYGLGLKHNLTQYFEKRYNAEDFQFAVVATYSNFKIDYAFEPISIPAVIELNRIDVEADLFLFQLLGSKLYDTFEVYGGLGVTSSTFEYEMGGSGIGLPPLNQELAGIDSNGIKFKGDLGFNYYFDSFKVSTMFTASNFFNFNLGLHYRIN
jgi:hypothetical protein